MGIERIGVVGAGTMGAGIVQVCARAGFRVVCEVEPNALESGLQKLDQGLARWADKGVIESTAAAEIRAAVNPTTQLSEVFDCELVIEAIVEDAEAKATLFSALDAGCASAAILASNTSSISITRLAAATGRADRSSECTSSTRCR